MADTPVVTTETPAAPAPQTGATKPTAQGAPGGAPPAGAQGRGLDGRFQGSQEKPAAQTHPRVKVKSKTGGEEEVELTPEYLQRAASFEREGHHRLQQLAKERKALEAERAEFKRQQEELSRVWKDPVALRKHLHDVVTDPEEAHRIKVQLLKLDLQDRNLSPEQRELQALRTEKEERERAEKEQAEKAAREEAERVLKEKAEKLRPRFIQTLSGVLDLGGLPVTERTLSRAAELFKENHVEGLGLDEQGMGQVLKEELDAELDARMSDQSLTDEDFKTRYAGTYERARRIAIAEMKARRATGGANVARQGPAVVREERPATVDGRRPPPKPLSKAEERALFGR